MAVVERRHHGHSYFRAGGAAWSRDCRIDDGGGGAAARGGVCLVTATVKREFSVAGEYRYDLAGPVRWIASHLLRYKPFLALSLLMTLLATALNASIARYTGAA